MRDRTLLAFSRVAVRVVHHRRRLTVDGRPVRAGRLRIPRLCPAAGKARCNARLPLIAELRSRRRGNRVLSLFPRTGRAAAAVPRVAAPDVSARFGPSSFRTAREGRAAVRSGRVRGPFRAKQFPTISAWNSSSTRSGAWIPATLKLGLPRRGMHPIVPAQSDEMWGRAQAASRASEPALARAAGRRVAATRGACASGPPRVRSITRTARLLEHILKIREVFVCLPTRCAANGTWLLAGRCCTHRKLQNCSYDVTAIADSIEGKPDRAQRPWASRSVRDQVKALPIPTHLQIQLAHLILSHHGAKGSERRSCLMTIKRSFCRDG